jgi:hypothetical protein
MAKLHSVSSIRKALKMGVSAPRALATNRSRAKPVSERAVAKRTLVSTKFLVGLGGVDAIELAQQRLALAPASLDEFL